jgi:cold shock protein
MQQGTIKFFDPSRGYGFVKPDDAGANLFFHVSKVADGYTPDKDDRVRFDVGTSQRTGKPLALNVRFLGETRAA